MFLKEKLHIHALNFINFFFYFLKLFQYFFKQQDNKNKTKTKN